MLSTGLVLHHQIFLYYNRTQFFSILIKELVIRMNLLFSNNIMISRINTLCFEQLLSPFEQLKLISLHNNGLLQEQNIRYFEIISVTFQQCVKLQLNILLLLLVQIVNNLSCPGNYVRNTKQDIPILSQKQIDFEFKMIICLESYKSSDLN